MKVGIFQDDIAASRSVNLSVANMEIHRSSCYLSLLCLASCVTVSVLFGNSYLCGCFMVHTIHFSFNPISILEGGQIYSNSKTEYPAPYLWETLCSLAIYPPTQAHQQLVYLLGACVHLASQHTHTGMA